MERRSDSLDAIRGIAILLIFAGHYFAPAIARNMPAVSQLSSMMWIGVDLFFILSGYLLGGLLMKHRDADCYYLPRVRCCVSASA
jgi:peptidoglycan/LPS O-acetylase OafA/YrhL